MYLGIDLGTSSVKTVLMDEAQRILASSSAEQSVSRLHDRWSEQDPADWIRGIEATFTDLQSRHAKEMASVRGIGLSGQQHGATLLDGSDEVIRPCILWNDTRSFKEAAELDTPRVRDLCGSIIFPGFTSPKLAWVANHEPDNFARVAKVLLPQDYARLWLTGEHVAEMSDNVVVAGGAGDNAASACGMGIVTPGSAFVSLGTSGVLFAANESYRPNAASAVHTFCHALPDTWHQMGVILAATDALNWLAHTVGKKPAELTASLEGTDAVPTEVIFLPYLGGERTPHNDANARGVFVGLGHSTDTTELTLAVLQGVSFAFRDSQHALADCGTTLSRAFAIGGGSRSAHWLQMLASTLNMPLDTTVDGDFGAGFGAARLGMIAAEGADPFAICQPPEINQTIAPDATRHADFEVQYQRYRQAYSALRSLMSPG